MQIVPPIFFHISKFQAPDCMNYNAVKIQHFSGDDTDKRAAQYSPTYANSSEIFIFGGQGLAPLSTLHPSPHQAFWIRHCVPPESQPDLRHWDRGVASQEFRGLEPSHDQ